MNLAFQPNNIKGKDHPKMKLTSYERVFCTLSKYTFYYFLRFFLFEKNVLKRQAFYGGLLRPHLGPNIFMQSTCLRLL